MKNLIISAVALLLVAACGQEPAEPVVAETKPLRSGIDLSAMDTSVKPGDDFFSYVNGKWVAETEIPADKSRFGVFDQLRDESQDAVKVIIEASANGDFENGTDEQKVGDMYKSFLDWDTRNARGMAPVQPELDRIASISDYDDLAVYFAETVKRNLDAPFGLGQVADFRDPNYYMIYAGQSGLGLPDREYYLKDDEKSEELRRQYVAHIETMYDLAGLENGAAAAATVMALETRLARENMTKEDSRNWTANYNKVAMEDLPSVMPNFNWDGYINEIGIQDVDSIVIFMTDYLKALDGIIVDTDLDTWKTYLTWTTLNNTASRLTRDWTSKTSSSTAKSCPAQKSNRKTGAAQ